MKRMMLLLVSGIGSMLGFSQYGQDIFVNEYFFKNKEGGVFIDIGASDGITLSNTYFFEKYLNWTGICFEPRPDKFAELCKNRTCHCVKGCIAEKPGTQQFLFLKGYTGDLSGLTESYTPQHVQRIKDEMNAQGGSCELISVPCYRLMEVVKEQGITHVDYLSIDTEGSEYQILSSIDFGELIIEIIDVENNYGDTRIAALLESRGYELMAKVGCDELYQRKS